MKCGVIVNYTDQCLSHEHFEFVARWRVTNISNLWPGEGLGQGKSRVGIDHVQMFVTNTRVRLIDIPEMCRNWNWIERSPVSSSLGPPDTEQPAVCLARRLQRKESFVAGKWFSSGDWEMRRALSQSYRCH